MIEAGLHTKQIENSQKRVEGHNFDIRKRVLEYDNVMNTQREIIYAQRRQVLEGQDIHTAITDMMADVAAQAVAVNCPEHGEWDKAGLVSDLARYFDAKPAVEACTGKDAKALTEAVLAAWHEAYAAREAENNEGGVDMREVERVVLLRAVDEKWMDHNDDMDQLRAGIGLRAVGQRDPVREYQFEGADMFDAMVLSIKETTLTSLMHLRLRVTPQRVQTAVPTQAMHANRAQAGPAVRKPVRAAQKVGRNDPCPCGSGKKYKNCCGKAENE